MPSPGAHGSRGRVRCCETSGSCYPRGTLGYDFPLAQIVPAVGKLGTLDELLETAVVDGRMVGIGEDLAVRLGLAGHGNEQRGVKGLSDELAVSF